MPALHVDDYTSVIPRQLTAPDGQEFVLHSYAGPVFAAMRQAMHIKPPSFVHSVCPKTAQYLEFISNSKSGQDFYLTNDKRYMIKTEKEKYIHIFLSFLGDYISHFWKYPHSLLVKILGVYSISFGRNQLFFFVMQSVFFPDERIDDRFDLKGCYAGRYQQAEPPGSKVITVLKDKNFKTETIGFAGGTKEWFIEQLRADTDFLVDQGVLDYSLLVGRQKLVRDDRRVDIAEVKSVKRSRSIRELNRQSSTISSMSGASDFSGSMMSTTNLFFTTRNDVSADASASAGGGGGGDQRRGDNEPRTVRKGSATRRSTRRRVRTNQVDVVDDSSQSTASAAHAPSDDGGASDTIAVGHHDVPLEDATVHPRIRDAFPAGKYDRGSHVRGTREVVVSPAVPAAETPSVTRHRVNNTGVQQRANLVRRDSTIASHTSAHDADVDVSAMASTATATETTRVPPLITTNAVEAATSAKNVANSRALPPITTSVSTQGGAAGQPLEKHTFSFIDAKLIRHMNIENRRLLPHTKNPLHVVDGYEQRYYVGIIDIFTRYECRQKGARIWKTLYFLTLQQHSTLPPSKYAERFVREIANRVK
ncbi:PREDICTED: uncharacterized protein LOC106812733 [Priapulus caudatus]|uniref:Uncharacterized protein LOC106812733 n=1 Tax=Priapulus caudatus TaxID=37621 RepID=A0ABM1EIZ8_PRICU|nr:PREDICTED: uncharacterized protein LOC106812733 [Priapulus caudatus]